ncbi:hypothetical protein JNN96_27915 [Mycobacterium sp. DSM 3803]|nr:hypothetical protein [Mycobacterium sp. DSM 3803]
MKFNAPPCWPVPKDWSPTPEWSPDPAWPAAPPGWVFWVEEDDAAADTADQEFIKPRGALPRLAQRWQFAIAAVVSFGVVAGLGLALLTVAFRPETKIGILPYTSTSPHTSTSVPEWPVRPDWPGPWSGKLDFGAWDEFGGVHAEFSNYGRSVVLDTRDTIDTWKTKWSGLSRQRQSRCDLRIAGRVRDISHKAGVPGGFGIGLGTVGPGDPSTAELTGSAIQFDFGLSGYRIAVYPDDTVGDVIAAPLDNQWHNIEVTIGTAGHTLVVDGQTVLQSNIGGQCGQPIIRVWAGSAEFADLTFLPN